MENKKNLPLKHKNKDFSKFYSGCLSLMLLLTVFFKQLDAQPIGRTVPVPLPSRLFGLTIDSVSDRQTIRNVLTEIKGASPTSPPPVVRIVLDVGNNPTRTKSEYFDIIKDIRGQKNDKVPDLAYIMVELVDSSPENSKKCITKECYRNRTQAYFDFNRRDSNRNREFFRDYVDIWEIGNEINGNWFGDLHIDPKAHRELVLSLINEAYKVFVDDQTKIKKARTAVTFYFNDDGEHHSYPPQTPSAAEYSMLTWIDAGQASFKNIDYVFISYYEDDNFDNYLTENGTFVRKPIRPEFTKWADIFSRIKTNYPSAKFGFGEFGPQCHYPLSDSCEDVIDPNNYKDPDKPTEAADNTCPKAFTRSAWNFHDESGSLWKRICRCCTKKQAPYISRYYSNWDPAIKTALNDKYSSALASDFVGGYFYWHFNPDVIDKLTFANVNNYPPDEKNQRKIEAQETLNAIKNAYSTFLF